MGRRGLHGGPYAVGDPGDEDGAPVLVTGRHRAELDAVEALERDPRIRAAAIIGHTFALDPVEVVLAERDPLKRRIRIAAHNVIQNQGSKQPPR